MRKTAVIFFSLVMAVSLAGCESDSSSSGGGGGGGSGVSGTWNGTGNYEYNSVPVTQFTLNLSQNGNAVSGSYAIKRDARDLMQGSVSGSFSGNSINMTMSPHGHASGGVSGNSMSLTWHESGFGGGDFTGSRNASVNLTR